MFYYLSQIPALLPENSPWRAALSPLRLFSYITFRSAGAAITALLLSWWLGPRMIRWLREKSFGQDYQDRADAVGNFQARVLSKKGIPTMGGLLIVLVLDVTTLLWARWTTFIQLTLLTVIVLGGLGFLDDYAKITRQNSKGVQELIKLWVQGALALFVALYLWRLPATSLLISQVMVPFYKQPAVQGAAGAAVGIVLTALTIVGSSNAVNLTDGLDGLAVGCTAIVSFVFLVLTYVAGNARTAAYLNIPHVSGAAELTVFCAAMIGTCLGFMWFNCHPAQVFMGDTGSLALGGVLAMLAVLIHQPLVLVLAGGVFVAEAASVLIQRGWFKYTRLKYGEGRRVFLMAPLHHHFEKLGWYESQIVTRFYILCVVCAVVALSTLKIR
jgi:phospho-N-acetylmuramoyl-pentapeptide-transferase